MWILAGDAIGELVHVRLAGENSASATHRFNERAVLRWCRSHFRQKRGSGERRDVGGVKEILRKIRNPRKRRMTRAFSKRLCE
jgi:hypothetical protein